MYTPMTAIEIFKTSVEKEDEASSLVREIKKIFPDIEVNFDLEDCDHILRVASSNHEIREIPLVLQQRGYSCEVL